MLPECRTRLLPSQVSAQLEASLKNLIFEPHYDPLMTFYNISYILSCLECHSHTFSQVSTQLKHFENL